MIGDKCNLLSFSPYCLVTYFLDFEVVGGKFQRLSLDAYGFVIYLLGLETDAYKDVFYWYFDTSN